MATAARWRATKRVIASIIYNINMCITMIKVVNAHDKKTYILKWCATIHAIAFA
jgi:hypothetical protein